MCKYFLLFLAFISFHLSQSQNFYFDGSANLDSITLNKNVTQLAKDLIKQYKEPDAVTYLNNLFRCQLVAKAYTPAIKSIQQYRRLTFIDDTVVAKGIAFQYEAYALSQIEANKKQIPFHVAYEKIFNHYFHTLPKNANTKAASYFVPYFLNTSKSTLAEALLLHPNADSINLETALKLITAYNAYQVYSLSVPLAMPLIAQKEKEIYSIQDSVPIKMRDGAIIYATIIKKRNTKIKQACVFVFSIYSDDNDKKEAKDAASIGYVCVYAYTRGKSAKNNTVEPFTYDANDAYDIIDWISKQTWSNGKVGMYGASYLGFTQWAACKKLHPALKTIVPQVSVAPNIDFPSSNGVYSSYMLQWLYSVCGQKEITDGYVGWNKTLRNYYKNGLAYNSIDTLDSTPNAIFQKWLTHPDYDTFWQKMVPYASDFSNITIPILTTTGYFDADQLGALYYLKQHYLHHKNPNHYLLIGPYGHIGMADRAETIFDGYEIDPVANISISKLTYDWLDYILKGGPKPAILKDRINYQVMGKNTWKHASTLSRMNNDTLQFYLSTNKVGTYHLLDNKQASTESSINQSVNFADKSDSLYYPYFKLVDTAFELTNKLVFISKPLASEIEMNGSLIGNLKASINKKDMDIVIQLYELDSSNHYFKLSDYLGRCSYAKDRRVRQLLKPNTIESIPIDNATFTSKKIAKGSRLLVTIGPNKNFQYEINYGAGKAVSAETIKDAGEPLQIKWYNDSYIKIPVWVDKSKDSKLKVKRK
jgi:uncharacterized protein